MLSEHVLHLFPVFVVLPQATPLSVKIIPEIIVETMYLQACFQ